MRPSSWCLISLCLALSAPAGAQDVKEWTPATLTKELNDIDRRLKDLERHTKPTDRRILDLEDHVRTLRVKVDLLEVQFKNLDGTLQSLRKEVAALTGRTETIEARPTPGTPTPPTKGTPVPSSVAVIRSQKVSMGADAITISGVVENKGDKPLVFVIVQADFLDKEGKVVKTESAYTEPRVIPAGSTADFVLKTPGDPRVKDHRLALRTE